MNARRAQAAVVLAATLAMVAPSCDGDDDGEPPPPPPTTTTPVPEPPARDRNVLLRLDRDSPHPGETLTLTVENRTRWRVEYGVAYRLERWTGERWRWVNRDSAFILILKVAEPGASEREEIRLPDDLRPGRYRIVKSFTAPAVDRRFDAAVQLTVANR